MKTSLVILAVAVVALQLFSAQAFNVNNNSQSFQSENSTKSGNFIDNGHVTSLEDDNEDIVSRFVDRVRNATKEILQEVNDYREQVGEKIRNAVQDRLSKLSANIQAFHAHLRERVKELRSSLKKRALEGIVNQLKNVDDNVKTLEEHVQGVRNSISDRNEKEEDAIVENWNSWASGQLASVVVATNSSKEALSRTESQINEFIDRYSNKLRDCNVNVDNELEIYETRVLAIIEHCQTIVKDLLQVAESCLESNDSLISSISCGLNANQQLLDLRSATADFAELIEGSLSVLKARLQRRACVVRTLANARLDRYVLERNIRLIEKNENQKHAK